MSLLDTKTKQQMQEIAKSIHLNRNDEMRELIEVVHKLEEIL